MSKNRGQSEGRKLSRLATGKTRIPKQRGELFITQVSHRTFMKLRPRIQNIVDKATGKLKEITHWD